MKKFHLFLILISILSIFVRPVHQAAAQNAEEVGNNSEDRVRLIIRADDIGFCHGVNDAIKRILEEGVVTSVSVMVTTPWLGEAVEIMKQHPEVSTGVHLTLNSEWKEFRWGPVLPANEVPSLVDAFGHFYGSRTELMKHKPKVEEVAAELKAQMELAYRMGLPVSYVDYHMSAAVSTLEFQEEVEKLALEYHVGISRYFGEQDTPNVYKIDPPNKLEEGIRIIESLKEPGIYLLVVHPGTDNPEMAAMTDLNTFGLKNMSRHRQAITDMLCDPGFKEAIERNNIELINYKDLAAEGLHKMKRGFVSEPYDQVVGKALPPSPYDKFEAKK